MGTCLQYRQPMVQPRLVKSRTSETHATNYDCLEIFSAQCGKRNDLEPPAQDQDDSHAESSVRQAKIAGGQSNLNRDTAAEDSDIVDDQRECSPLLQPRAEASDKLLYLESIPVFDLVHQVRTIISNGLTSVISWEQLQNLQINSVVVKPLYSELMTLKSQAMLYALLANKLQYTTEAAQSASQSSTNFSRAIICEFLAIKMLRNYCIEDLIDALTFDFWPLQGDESITSFNKAFIKRTRISALEVAIRTGAKHFLAHQLVIFVVEQIWKGNIVFYSSDEKLELPSDRIKLSASIYDVREASILKLSRLRVPLYRDLIKTVSFSVLLGLVLTTLVRRHMEVNLLEIVMGVWAVAYMLEEIVGFTESGISLYLMNLWKIFDGFILVLFLSFLILRLLSLLEFSNSRFYFERSQDILAINAIFLFPRLFSALDHLQYFSQMLISFRRMIGDLLTSMIFIFIFFSGFWVAFTFAFGRDFYTPRQVAFKLMQIFLGFSPSAWEMLDKYNFLGRCLLLTFVALSHFLVVTILVSVLSNTFSLVIDNAYEEHQYLFAVNTITSVKSEALFSYLTPFNLIEWLMRPLILFLKPKSFLKLNRTVIKITHLPFLFSIYIYERFFLSNKDIFERTRAFLSKRKSISDISINHSQNRADELFVPKRFRRESGIERQRARLLAEVFRRPLRKSQYLHGQVDNTFNSLRSYPVSYFGTAIRPRTSSSPSVNREGNDYTTADLHGLSNERLRTNLEPVSEDAIDEESDHSSVACQDYSTSEASTVRIHSARHELSSESLHVKSLGSRNQIKRYGSISLTSTRDRRPLRENFNLMSFNDPNEEGILHRAARKKSYKTAPKIRRRSRLTARISNQTIEFYAANILEKISKLEQSFEKVLSERRE